MTLSGDSKCVSAPGKCCRRGDESGSESAASARRRGGACGTGTGSVTVMWAPKGCGEGPLKEALACGSDATMNTKP